MEKPFFYNLPLVKKATPHRETPAGRGRALPNTSLDAGPANIAALVRGKKLWHKA